MKRDTLQAVDLAGANHYNNVISRDRAVANPTVYRSHHDGRKPGRRSG